MSRGLFNYSQNFSNGVANSKEREQGWGEARWRRGDSGSFSVQAFVPVAVAVAVGTDEEDEEVQASD